MPKATFSIVLLSILSLIFINCNNTESNEINNIYNNKDENSVYRIEDIIPSEEDYEVHYFGQWDFEEDYAYDPVDEYYDEMHDVGFFKFFYDEKGNVVAHARFQNNQSVKVAEYEYKGDKKRIIWRSDYSSDTGKPKKYQILDYYPDGRIKKLEEHEVIEGKDKTTLKIEYDEFKPDGDTAKRVHHIYDSNGKERIYTISEYSKNKYSDKPKYLKVKETDYIAFGEYKDKWFSVTKYTEGGEYQYIDINETKNDKGDTYQAYIERSFPEYFQ